MSEPSKYRGRLKIQSRTIDEVWPHFLRDGDARLGLAALGIELALRGDFRPEHIPYTNTYALEKFQRRYSKWGTTRIRWTVRILRLRKKFRSLTMVWLKDPRQWPIPISVVNGVPPPVRLALKTIMNRAWTK